VIHEKKFISQLLKADDVIMQGRYLMSKIIPMIRRKEIYYLMKL